MSERSAADERAVRFLLGRMTDDESRAVELEVLDSRETFDGVMVAEDDLIDEYLEGALSPEERVQFERVYLSAPDRRSRVEFARALRDKLGRDRAPASAPAPIARIVPAPRAPWLPWMAAAAALFAGIGVYFAIDASRLRREVGEMREAKVVATRHDAQVAGQMDDLKRRSDRLERDLQAQRDESGRLSEQLATLREQGGRVVSFLLSATLVREGGQLQALVVPANAAARLTLPVTPGTPYASYRAVVQSPEGKSYWAGTGTWPSAAAKTVVVTVPAGALPPGDYILSLTGVKASGEREPAADFSFRIKRG